MGFVTFLILFILISNFPGFIINPLHEFAEALHDVSNKNYNTRLHFETSDEFVQLSHAFNAMAEKIVELENTNLTKIMSGEIRIKKLIEEMQDGVIGTDEKQEVLFVNTAARKILNLDEKQKLLANL